MKSRTRKRMFRGAAAALACVAAAGIFLQTTISAEAAANSLPGIDIIVNGNSSEKPFRILELVDKSENAEIGYYVSGQEPTVKLYTYIDDEGNTIHFSTFEEGLGQLPEEKRKEFAMNVKINADGSINDIDSTGISKVEMKETAEDEAPISYKEYQEKYFLENSDNADDWTQIDLKDADGNSRVDSVEANGSYVENQAGTGNYTKEEQQYYPIRGDVDADSSGNELFRENIQSFSYVEDEDTHGAYFLQFSEVGNEDVNAAFSDEDNDNAQSALENIQSEYDYTNGRYGYYENVYTDLTKDIATNINNGKYTFPGENPDASVVENGGNAVPVTDNSVASADTKEQQRLGEISDGKTAGTQANPYIYLGETIDSYPYYKYTLVGDLAYVQEKASETHDGYKNGDIILEDGQYWYLMDDPASDGMQLLQMELSIVTGRQQVAYEDIASIPIDFDYNYYYVVDKVWFCSQKSSGGSDADPSDYQFFGWYYPTYPSGEDIYLPVSDNETPTYYISEAQYTLTPGIGDYDFVPSSGDDIQLVQVNQMYYQGGYENCDWLKKYVFHLGKDEYDGFNIQVDTRYADNVGIPVYAGVQEDTNDAVDTDVTSYDLIYVNGDITDATAKAIVDNKIPCIVNGSRVTSMSDAFSDYINGTDDDGNYVSKHIYFFEGTDASGEGLVNNDFHKEFTATQKDGFEEITEYIDQENQYRNLDQNLEQLSDVLSQARAVEYIINYQYKRNTNLKSEINVLEIMPDKDCSEISENDVEEWLGVKRSKVTISACCEQANYNSSIKNITSSDLSSIWHSAWEGSGTNYNHGGNHYVDVTFDSPEAVKGFVYTARNDGINGVMTSYKVELYDGNGNLINSKKNEEITGKTGFDSNNHTGSVTIQFDAVNDVKKMRIIFTGALSVEAGKNFASCARLEVLYGDESNMKVTVNHMTAAEFVGHIDDIASEYDMIYISGTKLSSSNSYLTGDGELRYAHVGSGKQIVHEQESNVNGVIKLLGQLDTDYLLNSDGTKVTAKEWKVIDEVRQYVDVNFFAPLNTYGPNSGGYLRGSGNDMTSQQCEKLLNFVKSGYPVIVSDELLSGEEVNTNRVDNASYYYEFLSEALEYDNVMSVSNLSSGKSNLLFFTNLAKPVIKFAENGKPPEPPRLDETTADNADYVDGELKYVFTIENDSDAAPASTTYDCQLYLDLNFDGNLSSTEEQEKYITIQDEDGNVMSQTAYGNDDLRYELQAGKQYTLTRKLPEDYYKLITWKLEISSNTNSYIHTSEMGYAKQQNTTGVKQEIKVLQILPQKSFSDNAGEAKGGNWVLNDKNGTFQKLISQVEDFDIQIDVIYVTNPEDGGNYPKDVTSMSDGEMKQKLKDYQMLVIGFNDVYQDIPNDNHQVDDILDFIKSGKSVLFSHDTTSYINYDKNYMHGKIADTEYGQDEYTSIYSDSWLFERNPTWGLSMNTILRSVVGMDRYGITSDEEMNNGQTVSSLLKKGKALNSNSVSFEELMELAGDVAWTTNDGRNSSYGQTQAYTNNMFCGTAIGSLTTTKAKKVNDGAITQYPYRMSDLESTSDQTLSIAETHGQYYQLALEQDRDVNGRSDGESDIVVWYCLTGSEYSKSPNDVRNNYYFYSKGNVIYTGAGHKLVDSGNNSGEMKLFINAMVAAANVTAVDPEVNFVDNLNPTADVETTRYYATDQSTWSEDNEANVLEDSMDFYVNVKDYNMVSADLNQDDLDQQEMTLEFYINSDDGDSVDGAPDTSKMIDITNAIGSLKGYDGTTTDVDSDEKFHLTQNSAYQLTLSNPEQYLRTTGSATSGNKNGYQKDCKLYVKVTSTVYLYGEPKVSTKWASIDLKQRQLFELN